MKKAVFMFVIIATYFISMNNVCADTIYLGAEKTKTWSQILRYEDGELANLLTKWEKENPTKRIICVTPALKNGDKGCFFTGYLVTFEEKRKE